MRCPIFSWSPVPPPLLQKGDNCKLRRAGPWSVDLGALVLDAFCRQSCHENRRCRSPPLATQHFSKRFQLGDGMGVEAMAAVIAVKPLQSPRLISRCLLEGSSGDLCKICWGGGGMGQLLPGVNVSLHKSSATPSSSVCTQALGSEVWECWPLTFDLPQNSNSKKQCPKSACNDSSLIPTAWLVKRSESTNRNWPDKSDFFYLPA